MFGNKQANLEQMSEADIKRRIIQIDSILLQEREIMFRGETIQEAEQMVKVMKNEMNRIKAIKPLAPETARSQNISVKTANRLSEMADQVKQMTILRNEVLEKGQQELLSEKKNMNIELQKRSSTKLKGVVSQLGAGERPDEQNDGLHINF